jgi:hypothetical protein
MSEISEHQNRILCDVGSYLRACAEAGVDTASSEYCRVSTWAPGPGADVMRSLAGRRVRRLAGLRNLLGVLVRPQYEVADAVPRKGAGRFRLVVVSWVSRAELSEEGHHADRYFGVDSAADPDIAWVLLSADGAVPNVAATNVTVIVPVRPSITDVLRRTWYAALLCSRVRPSGWRLLGHRLSALHSPADAIERQVLEFGGREAGAIVAVAYEAQAYQHALIDRLRHARPDWMIVGYMHSVLPSLPADFIRRRGAPDLLLVNGEGQARMLVEHLGWPSESVMAIPSLRYTVDRGSIGGSVLYLPYALSDSDGAVQCLRRFMASTRPSSLVPFDVRNHPDMRESRVHARLIAAISDVVDEYADRFSNEPGARNLCLFIGVTGSVIERLEDGFEAVQLSSDPLFEVRTPPIWSGLDVRELADGVYEYHLVDGACFLERGPEGRDLRAVLIAAACGEREQQDGGALDAGE